MTRGFSLYSAMWRTDPAAMTERCRAALAEATARRAELEGRDVGAEAARILGITRRTWYRWLKRYPQIREESPSCP